MRRTSRATVACALILPSFALGYTWPNARTDYLETVLYQQTGFREERLSFAVVPCSHNILTDSNRTTSAEWFRTAYHDMATADVEAGTGGIDGSIGFETDRAENIGSAMNGSISFFAFHHSVRGSMADIIALGAQMALASCTDGNLQVPFRGGRVDAIEAGPLGVPEPHQDIESHIASFKKQGFNVTEMIGLVACGHSLGGVHGFNFPAIVDQPEDENVNVFVGFDGTHDHFDNTIATEFVNNVTQNPLAFGHNQTTNSDHRIFSADGGDLIGRMAESNDFFVSTCRDLVERMINTVPKGVELTDVIEPVEVKPDHLQINVNGDGTMDVSGEIRFLEDASTLPSRIVLVQLFSRDGLTRRILEAWTEPSFVAGARYPNMPRFTFYKFQGTIPISQGVSSFVVRGRDENGNFIFNNGGAGFPWSDKLAPQLSNVTASCKAFDVFFDDNDELVIRQTVRVATAVRDDLEAEKVVLSVPRPVSMVGSLAVRFEQTDQIMERSTDLDGTGYALYKGEFIYDLNSTGPKMHYDIVAVGSEGNTTSAFHWFVDLSNCPETSFQGK